MPRATYVLVISKGVEIRASAAYGGVRACFLMRQTGIYKIANLINGKFYIGQSRDIFTRWKAHTRALCDNSRESVIRMAFAKYHLREQVSKEGVFGNFSFEIIEICAEEKLIERETHYIQTLQPEYNVQLMGANSIFPKRLKTNIAVTCRHILVVDL